MKTYLDIPGWYDWDQTYSDIVNNQPGGILVEVGTYLGRSLCHLGQLVKESGKPFRVIGVDHCMGSGVENGVDNHGDAVHDGGGSFYKKLIQNIYDCGLEKVISILLKESVAGSHEFLDNSLSMVFLDASHDYESVKRDIIAWLPKVKIGGILAGDDVGVPNEGIRVWPGIKQAVDELLPGWIYSPHDAWIYHKRG